MTFDAPLWLLVALAVPVLFLVQWLVQRRRMRYAISYTNTSVLASVATKPSWRRSVPLALFASAFLVLAMGMAKPQAEVAVPRDEATIILAVDVSGSMQSEDVSPTRMTAAKKAAASFIDKLPERFRIALVSFSDVANVLAQPTTDRSSTQDAIASLEAEGGTAMGEALIQSIELVQEDRDRLALPTPSITPSPEATPSPAPDERERVSAVLLLSDGYNTTGVSPLTAAVQARTWEFPFTRSLSERRRAWSRSRTSSATSVCFRCRPTTERSSRSQRPPTATTSKRPRTRTFRASTRASASASVTRLVPTR